MKKLLIGGQALRNLGHDRHTDDVDFLINDNSSKETFTFDKANNVDYINCANNKFFTEIWSMEKNNTSEIASIDALAELKAYSFVQHCLNGHFAKADAAEYDLKFLARLGAKMPTIVQKYVAKNEFMYVAPIFSK
jgi:hypothetical protein